MNTKVKKKTETAETEGATFALKFTADQLKAESDCLTAVKAVFETAKKINGAVYVTLGQSLIEKFAADHAAHVASGRNVALKLDMLEQRQWCYDLVQYKKRNPLGDDISNAAFESAVTRAVKAAVLVFNEDVPGMVRNPAGTSFDAPANVLRPEIKVPAEQPDGSIIMEKAPNPNTKLCPITVKSLEAIYTIKYPGKKREGQQPNGDDLDLAAQDQQRVFLQAMKHAQSLIKDQGQYRATLEDGLQYQVPGEDRSITTMRDALAEMASIIGRVQNQHEGS